MYAEIVPGPRLQPFLECFWTIRSEGGVAAPHRVLPDGCADLIFDLTPGFETAFWVGAMTRSLVVEDARPRHLLGLRFHPGGARGLLGLPLKELTDQRASFQSLTPEVEVVLDELLQGRSSRLDIVQRWLIRTFVADHKFPLVQSICRHVQNSEPGTRVRDIASLLGLSSQYLNRVMKDGVGTDLKTFSRIIRMRACTQRLRGADIAVDWPSLALDFGFYDQSHLIHEFNDLVGLSPRQFLAN
jgi:AraC-like DNA-binding protein